VKTYIKKDLVDMVVTRIGGRQGEVARTVDALFQAMRDVMSLPDPESRIEIRDFGVFEVKQTKAKPKARNPRTNELVYVPARRKTHFRPGKHLKAALRSDGIAAQDEPRAMGDLAAQADGGLAEA
jgi:integration host factor subunit beta